MNAIMRGQFAALLACCCAGSVCAQSRTQPETESQSPPASAGPPPFTLVRYDENYSYLADRSLRLGNFDALKYIPLDPGDPKSYITIGGEFRERYEFYVHPAFGLGGDGHDDYLLQRLVVNADVRLNEHVRLFAQGISAFQWGQDAPRSPADTDAADVQQGFGDVLFGDADRGLTLRVGRQEMSYGSSRLIAVREAPNVHFTHDAVRGTLEWDDVKIDGFLSRIVNPEKYRLDDWNSGQDLWGLYGALPVGWGGVLRGMDLYYLGYRNEHSVFNDRRGTQTRHSIGARFFGGSAPKGDEPPSGFDFDVEGVFQFGDFGGDPIRAWTIASDFGYTFTAAPLSPRLGLKADIASGGPDHPGGTVSTFDPLLFKAGYFNDASLLRPSNLIDVHPTVELFPSRDTKITLGYDVVWRYSNQDGLYAPPGSVQVDGAANSSRFAGSSLEVALEWKISRHVSWTTSYVHFFSGSFIRGAGGKDVDFIGSWIDFKF